MLGLHAAIEDAGLLEVGGLLNLATGSGKTYLAKRASIATVKRGQRVIYVSPLRSLAREVAREWGQESQMAAFKVGLFTGEMGVDDGSDVLSPRDADVCVMTAEKLDSHLRNWMRNMDWLVDVGLVVVDELHTIGEGCRGAALDGTLTRLRQINPYASILALSATMGNTEEVAAWLGVQPVSSRIRWIPLKWRVATFRPGQGGMANRAMVVLREVRDTTAQGGQTLVFVQSRLRAEQLAGSLERDGIRAKAHHAGIGQQEREEIEQGLRAGALDCVVATPTLAMGVNLPVRKVVIHDLQRYEQGTSVTLTVNEVWQLGGRAGRKGLDESGEVVLLAGQHEAGQAWQYTKGQFESVQSRMDHPAALAGQVLAMVGSKLAASHGQLERLMSKTLAAHQVPALLDGVAPCVDAMVSSGMLAIKGDDLVATRMGAAAVRHMIGPATVGAWRWVLEEAGNSLSFIDLLILAASASECALKLRVRKDQLPTIGAMLRHEPMWLRLQSCSTWCRASACEDGARLLSGLAAACAMRQWSHCGDASKAGALLGLSAGDVDDLRKEVLRTLIALKDVAACGVRAVSRHRGLATEPKIGEKLRAVIAMTTCGLNARAATLALVDGVGPSFARCLMLHGIRDITMLSRAQVELLMTIPGIAEKRACSWISQAQALHVRGGAYRYEEAETWAGQLVEPDAKADAVLLQSLWRIGKES